MKDKVYLGLGSNQGDKEEWLRLAIEALAKLDGVKVERVSSLYATAPIGYLEQDDFLNCAVRIDTELTPHELLSRTQQIERELKRERKIHWGPRTIDIDILIFKTVEMEAETKDGLELTIPHKEMKNRAFVLEPLIEIMEDSIMVKELKQCLVNVANQKIKKVEEKNGRGISLFGQ